MRHSPNGTDASPRAVASSVRPIRVGGALNRLSLRRMRAIRRELEIEEYIRSGVHALKHYPIDQLPPQIRAKALSIGRQVERVEQELRQDIDSILRDFAGSEMAEPDHDAGLRARARSEDRAELRRLFAGTWRGREVSADRKQPSKGRGGR